MTAMSIADDNGDVDTLVALLTLAASGLAAEVISGTQREDAAVHLGRLLVRAHSAVVLSCRGHESVYRWPEDWQRAVSDCARSSVPGAMVTVRRADRPGGRMGLAPDERGTPSSRAPLVNAAAAKPQVHVEGNAGGAS